MEVWSGKMMDEIKRGLEIIENSKKKNKKD
jgi:hypothetical protein